MKWCVTAIISKMKCVARWHWLRKVKSLHSPVCFCYGVTTAHVNIWNTFNCCKQRFSLDTGSRYWEAVLTVPEGILGLKPLQMRVRKEIKILCIVASTLLHAHQGCDSLNMWQSCRWGNKSQQGVFGLAWPGPQATGRKRRFYMGESNGDISLRNLKLYIYRCMLYKLFTSSTLNAILL